MIALLLLAVAAFAQAPARQSDEKITIKSKVTAKDYDELLAKVKSGDMTINFAKLRLAYTETKDYAPYGGSEARNQMYDAFNKGDSKGALQVASKTLETNFVDLASQFVSWRSHSELGNKKGAEFHEKVFNSLMAALKENDGLSPKTAIISIGIAEQYFIMSHFGFQRQVKTLERLDGSIFDVHTSLNSKTNETRKFFFNIDKVFGKF